MLNETTAIAPKPDTNPPPPYESSALGPDEPSGSTSEPEAGPTSPNKGGNEPPWHIRRDAILLGLVAGLIGGGLFFAIAHFALERNDPRLAQLQMRVQGMEETLASLDTRLRNLPPDLSGNVATLDNRLDGLDAQVAKLPTSQPDVGPLRKDVSALEENMTALQQSVQGMSGQLSSFDERLTAVQNVVQRGSALQLAVEDAARALREGGSVADPAARLKALANDDAGLAQAADALNSADGKGIVSIASLRQQLDAIEPPTVGEAPAAATGWLGGITANVSKLVDVRGIDTRRDAIRQALDQARIRLADGDLAAARDAVAPLARDQLAGAAAWVAAADNRLQAEQAIASARQRVDAIIGSMR
ncbi:hypothetical protein [Arboricoccus pini]|nr:hypothetical protein [Arboricoccus pini]